MSHRAVYRQACCAALLNRACRVGAMVSAGMVYAALGHLVFANEASLVRCHFHKMVAEDTGSPSKVVHGRDQMLRSGGFIDECSPEEPFCTAVAQWHHREVISGFCASLRLM